MSLIQFWNDIHDTGHVVADDEAERIDAPPSDALAEAIAAVERDWRLELAFAPPPLVMPPAVWAARLMHRAAQFLVYRQIDAATVAHDLSQPCPAEPSPAVCYSVDLAMRLLPDVVSQARAIAEDDPLTIRLLTLARKWPLSSVGVTGIDGDIGIAAFIDDPCLRRLYVDRIIARRDQSRLHDPRVAVVVRESLGSFPEQAPDLVKALNEFDGSNELKEPQ